MNQKNIPPQQQPSRSEGAKPPKDPQSQSNDEAINVELNHKEWPYGHFVPHHEEKGNAGAKKQNP